jgi:ATP-dependent RNA helicase DeaD
VKEKWEPMENFEPLNLNPLLMRVVRELGYEKPSPIQAQALPILLGERTDFIGLAATGTGKTAAFTLPILEKLDPKQKGVQAIILCPTRELCMQVAWRRRL